MASYLKSDSNGAIIVNRGLAWVIGLTAPIVILMLGYGLAQARDIASIEERLEYNAMEIDAIRAWGPVSGDRYTAKEARDDWSSHSDDHALIMSELLKIDAKVSAIAEKLK